MRAAFGELLTPWPIIPIVADITYFFAFNIIIIQSNRLSCLRIVERCAGMLYFVREQIEGAGPIVGKELDAAFHVFRQVIFQVCFCYPSASALVLTPA